MSRVPNIWVVSILLRSGPQVPCEARFTSYAKARAAADKAMGSRAGNEVMEDDFGRVVLVRRQDVMGATIVDMRRWLRASKPLDALRAELSQEAK